MRERLQSDPSVEVQANLLQPGLEADLDHYFMPMNLINAAHFLMLMKQGIIDQHVGQSLAAGIQDMLALPPTQLALKAAREDLYFNIEAHLIERLGGEVAGRLHTGRSRNDLIAAATRIKVREYYFDLSALLLEAIEQVQTIARREVGTVMPGYTHMQPAEPITLGYYLAGICQSLERDYARLEQLYERLNLSPLGACAMAGTSFHIDRNLVSEYLGFDGVLKNGLDAVASRDYAAELLFALALAMTTVGRLAQDLYIWATDEFRCIEVADAVAASSSIMPQKKNPITLEHIKAKASHVSGALVSMLTVFKGTPFSHSRDISTESFTLFWPALSEVSRALRLLRATLTDLKVNRYLLLSRAKQDFITVTELANDLVREAGLSFRKAHGVIGTLVGELVSKGKTADAIDASALKTSLADAGIVLHDDLLQHIIERSMDPLSNASAKRSAGPAPDVVLQTLDKLHERLKNHKTLLASRQDAVIVALARMIRDLSDAGAGAMVRD